MKAHAVLGALALLIVLSAAVPAAERGAASAAAAQVVKQGFCLRKVELRCLEVALPAGAPIELNRLPELPDGQHGIWFYSDQVAAPKAAYVQVLEALDDDAHVDYRSSDSAAVDEPRLARQLKALAARLAASGRVVLTAFRGHGGAEPVRSFSFLDIDGPGEFDARVVDLDGATLPGSARITISVMISAAPRPN